MDVETCIRLLTDRGYLVEDDDRHLVTERGSVPEKEIYPDAPRRYLVFNPNSPHYFESGGAPNFFDERELTHWVQHVMLPVWTEDDQEAL